jgi:hypothetical protein
MEFRWVRLDADEPRPSSAFGAGRADSGRAVRHVYVDCAHAMMMRQY